MTTTPDAPQVSSIVTEARERAAQRREQIEATATPDAPTATPTPAKRTRAPKAPAKPLPTRVSRAQLDTVQAQLDTATAERDDLADRLDGLTASTSRQLDVLEQAHRAELSQAVLDAVLPVQVQLDSLREQVAQLAVAADLGLGDLVRAHLAVDAG